jgi:hypothetical protein
LQCTIRFHRIVFAAWLLVLLPSTGQAEAAARNRGVPVRLRLTFVEAMPVTTIVVGGKTIRAIVDTSAGDADGELTLSRDVIERAGGVSLGKAVMDDERGRRFLRPKFRIPEVEVDGRVYRDVRAVEALPRESGEASPTANVIGKHFLARHFVVVNFAGATISLWPRDSHEAASSDCGATRLPVERTKEAQLAVSAFEMTAGRVHLMWSTNANYSILSTASAKKLALATVDHGPGSPRFFKSRSLEATGREFGPIEFVVLPLELPDGVDGMVGKDFFDNHVVCFDYGRSEVRVR